MLPHWDRSYRSNFLPPQTQYTYKPGQPVPAPTLKHLAPGRVATEVTMLSHWSDSTRKNSHGASANRTSDLPLSRPTRRRVDGKRSLDLRLADDVALTTENVEDMEHQSNAPKEGSLPQVGLKIHTGKPKVMTNVDTTDNIQVDRADDVV